MKKIKILYIISSLRYCGPVNVLFHIISNLNVQTFEVRILTLKKTQLHDEERFQKLGIEVIECCCRRNPMFYYMDLQEIKNRVKRINPDIIHVHCFRSTLYAAFLSGYKRIVTVHNYPNLDYRMRYKWRGILMAVFFYKAIEKYDKVIGCSQSVRNHLCKETGHSDKCSAILNGIEMKNVTYGRCEARKKLHLPLDVKVIVWIGSLIHRKNPLFFIDRINEIENDVLAVMLGDGELKNICELRCKSNILILGSVNNVNDYLMAADAYVSTSYAEGMPNSVLEAMSMGNPVLLSDIEPHREILSMNKKIGFLYDLNNADDFRRKYMELMRDLGEFKRKNIREHAMERFSAETMGKAYSKMYHEVCKI